MTRVDSEELVPARRIGPVANEVLSRDLGRYREAAIGYGATDALVIPASAVTVDERVRLKCMVPRCHLYGESPNCPPYTPPPDEVRQVLSKYTWAVLFKHDVTPIEDFLDKAQWHRGHMAHQGKTDEIASKVESLAFNDGHYLAVGFGAGGCKTALCRGQMCQFLDSGRCRHPLRARPSMEAMGIDVFGLVSSVGWEVYPLAHRNVDPASVACAISVGIVFIC